MTMFSSIYDLRLWLRWWLLLVQLCFVSYEINIPRFVFMTATILIFTTQILLHLFLLCFSILSPFLWLRLLLLLSVLSLWLLVVCIITIVVVAVVHIVVSFLITGVPDLLSSPVPQPCSFKFRCHPRCVQKLQQPTLTQHLPLNPKAGIETYASARRILPHGYGCRYSGCLCKWYISAQS